MDAVNLLPLEYRARKKKSKRLSAAEQLDGRRTLRLGGIAALVFAVLLGMLFWHEHSLVQSKKKELADTQARIATVEPQVQVVKAAKAAIAGRVGVAQSIVGTRMNWDRALDDFARVIPTNSYLTSLQLTAPVTTAAAAAASTTAATSTDSSSSSSSSTTTSPPAATTTASLSVIGVAPSTPGVAKAMDRLGLLPWLSNLSLTSATRQQDGTYTFTISGSVSEEH